MRRTYRNTLLALTAFGLVYACSDAELVIDNGNFNGEAGADGSGNSTGSGDGPSFSIGGDDDGSGASNGNGASSNNGTGGAGERADASYPDATFSYTPNDGGGGACATVTGQAVNQKRPMDIIISIDNSSSMAGEIAAVQQRVNEDFYDTLEEKEIDYRVIMVSRYGYLDYSPGDTDYSVCIREPLGASTEEDCTDEPSPQLVNNAPKFFQHSTDIGSHNMWCRLLASYAVPDEYPDTRSGWNPVTDIGWKEWLRPEAFKVFIGITDDNPLTNTNGDDQKCTNASGLGDTLAGAQAFDAAIRALDDTQFEDENGDRNYAWYGIVGMTGNDATNPTPLEPGDPVETTKCSNGGEHAGVGYQELSRLTGGLRYPSCFNDNFDDIFSAIANSVVDQAVIPCNFDLPEVEGIINIDNIEVTYTPSGGGSNSTFNRVDAVGDCTGEQYYLDSNTDPTQLFLCPDSCDLIQADTEAAINIDFGCLGS